MTCAHHWTVTSGCPFCLREQVNQLRADLAAARALPTAMANGYTAGSVTEHEFHSIHLHYNTRQQAVAAFEAISDAIDAALAGSASHERRPDAV